MAVRVTGMAGPTRRLKAIEERLRSPDRFLRAEAAELERVARAAIASQRSPSGTRWPTRKADGAPALQGFAASVFGSVSKGRVRVEVAHPAASIHFFGAPDAGIPARAALPTLRDGTPDGSPFWTETPRRVDAFFSAEDVPDGD